MRATVQLDQLSSAHPNGRERPAVARTSHALVLSVLAGVMVYVAVEAAAHGWLLASVALVPLFAALDGRTAKGGLALGLVFGATSSALGFAWTIEALGRFTGLPWWACSIGGLVFAILEGAKFGLAGWLARWTVGRGWPAAACLGLSFLVAELVCPGLIPWYLGVAARGLPALTQVAELGGPIAVTLLVVCANIAIYEVILGAVRRRRPATRVVILATAVVLIGAGWGAIREHHIDAAVRAAEKSTVAIVQADIGPLDKWASPRDSFDRHAALTAKARAEYHPDLVIWSETAIVTALDENRFASEYPSRFTGRLGGPTLVGAALYRKVGSDLRLINTALITDAAGHVQGRYDKHYLFPFGEYMPLGWLFPSTRGWLPNSHEFAAGITLDALPFEGRKIATTICFEDLLPSFTRDLVNAQSPQLLVNLTNDAWFGSSSALEMHMALASLRAVEQRKFLVRATNTGVSAIIDPVGRILTRGAVSSPEILAGEIAWLPGRTIYARIGDLPWWACTLMTVALTLFRRCRGATVGASHQEALGPAGRARAVGG